MSRIIFAESVGCRVPKNTFTAAVHSVFRSSANLRIANLDHLLTLFAGQMIDLPQGIRLPDGAVDSIQRLEVGQSVTCEDERLRWAGIEIDLRRARRFDGGIPRAASEPRKGDTLTAWQAARDLLAARQEKKEAALRITAVEAQIREARSGATSAPGENPTGDCSRNLSRLARAADRLDSGLAAASVLALAGLGGGLTPTGDDALVGFLAGLWAQINITQDRTDWRAALAETVRAASYRTNDISRTYLVLAAEGQFSSSLAGLAEAVCDGRSPETARAAAEAAFQAGHTSGLDAVTGLLAGLAVWHEDLFPDMKGTR